MVEGDEKVAVPSDVERRIVSVLFADLVGFTPLSEALDAEDVATVQDAYFSSVRETVQWYGGVLEKFIGDAAMAVFGAPRARDDDAERAVRAGLALIGALEQLEARLGMSPGTLRLRVGVNTGEVVHAISGPDAGRVTGDTVNTAARFQSAARPGTVMIGEVTALSVAETIELLPIGTVELKGKAAPVRGWEAVGARSEPSREEALGGLRAPMIGRDAELDRLREALRGVGAAAVADRVVIVAPPGVGKSRLLDELARTADAPLFRGRVRPQATAPYDTVGQLFASATAADVRAALERSGVAAARAGVVEHEVRRLLQPGRDSASSGSDVAGERDARFDAWLTALDALAEGPSLWLVEDVHWAGGDLLAFLDFAGRAPTRRGRLVVATSRPSLLETAPEWSAVTTLDLGPLPASDAGDLVHALLGSALPRALVAAIVERSDGTPLFIEELLRTWASVGTLVHTNGEWTLAVPPEAVTLPPTVQAIYAAQLDDLPPDARLVARRGAVAGRRLPLGAFPSLELDDGHAGLHVLRRRGFLAGPVADAITGDGFAYRHALLRDAGYASLGRTERGRLHVSMARWLAEAAGERADVVAEAIAEHYASALGSLSALGGGEGPDRATLAREAATWYERAAAAALRLSAHEAARRLLVRAIELSDPGSPLDLARRRLRLGEILAASADLGAGVTHLEAAVAAFRDHPAEYAEATCALARAYMQQIRFREAEALTGTALERLAGESPDRRARLHALHAWTVGAQGRSDGVLAETDLAWAAAQAVDDRELQLDVLEAVNAARDEIGEIAESDWASLEDTALIAGRWRQVVVAARVRAVMQADSDPRSAILRLDRASEVAAAHGLTEQAGWVEYSRCEMLWTIGEWARALAVGRSVIATAERYAYGRLAFRTWVVLLPMAAVRGDEELADAWARSGAPAVDHVPSTVSPYGRILGAAIDAWTAQARGLPTPIPPADLIEALVPMGNPHFIGAVETITRAWLDGGRADLARMAAAAAARHASDRDSTPLMRASAALLDAWVTRSEQSARAAARLARDLPAPWWEMRALRLVGDTRADEIEAGLRA